MTHKRGTTGPTDAESVGESGTDVGTDAALADAQPDAAAQRGLAEPDPQADPQPDAQPDAAAQRGLAEPDPQADPQPDAQPDPAAAEPISGAQPSPQPPTIGATLALVDRAWARFHALASQFPPERMDERLDGGWTRKQMLAHVAGWHDLASDRLLAFVKSGERQRLEDDVDVINGRFARAAAGRTAGEVLHTLEMSFRRLRRQVEAMTDEQLAMHEGWPAAVIAGDTFDHYAEHGPELERPGALADPRR